MNKQRYHRQLGIIDPDRLDIPIIVIGAGSVGSFVIMSLAKMGCSDITICDFDIAGTTVTGGQELMAYPLAGKNDKGFENVLPYKMILHPGETITMAGSSAASATIHASPLWKELF